MTAPSFQQDIHCGSSGRFLPWLLQADNVRRDPRVIYLQKPCVRFFTLHKEDECLPIKPPLTIETLCAEAATFAEVEAKYDEPALYGVTDGKAVGTYLEHKFVAHLVASYEFPKGNSASGIDIPSLGVDIKVTSVKQPQSSSPFRSARQKIYGLGYHLIIFVYDKTDDNIARTARLDMAHTIFVDKSRTADFQMTRGLLDIIERDGNDDDIVAFLQDKHLPVDEIEARNIAEAVLADPPGLGYLTISNALQWRLQYKRVITHAGDVSGINRVR